MIAFDDIIYHRSSSFSDVAEFRNPGYFSHSIIELQTP